jgi:hypothetical protein
MARGDKGRTQLAFLAFVVFILAIAIAGLVISGHRP